ncbi:hypothetical protein, partial [Thermogutta sp.]|uniref:hypothetical protein n=1 Tax=Thermogutta sp. TaxID=1962930 RepID=UPI0032208C64
FDYALQWLGFGAKTAIGYGFGSLPPGSAPKTEAFSGAKAAAAGGYPKHSNTGSPTDRAEERVPGDLHEVQRILQKEPTTPLSRAETEQALNLISRHYRHPMARDLARMLAHRVVGSDYLSRLVKSNPIVKALLED